MFEDALLDSSPRRLAILSPIHYLLSAFAGALCFVLFLHLLPLPLAPAGDRGLGIVAATLASVAALFALMLCYVWASTRQQHLRAWPWLGVTLLLNLPGFLAYLVYSARKTGDWKRAAMPLAYIAQAMLVGALVLVPLIYTQALPKQLLFGEIHISTPPGPPAAHVRVGPAKSVLHPNSSPLAAPATIPQGIRRVVDTPQPLQAGPDTGPWVIGAIPGGHADGTLTAIISGVPSGTSLPPPPPTHATPKQRLVRIGGDVIAARALYQPPPAYPPLAMTARVQGTVVLQATIGKDGTVQDLKVLSGHPLLVHAAMDAVKTWRYQPTLLDSEPVDVLTEIDVNFKLSE